MSMNAIYPRKGGGGGSSSHGGGTGKGGGSSSNGKGGKGGGSGSNGKGGSGGGSKGSPAASKGAPKSFTNSRYSSPFSLNTGKTKGKSSATPYSNGGGKPFALSSGLFSGRLSGGGQRFSVYGTRTYGSGYPYGGYGYYVSGRPFPYVFIPVPIHRHYYGCDEYYDNVTSTDRPGGALVSALVQPSYNTSAVTYRLVGDNSSVNAVLAALVANCSVANATNTIVPFSPSDSGSGTWPLPEQVIQWYRASSFALTLDGYNNSAALASNQPSSNDSTSYTRPGDTPLPANLNMTFLNCVNQTTGESVPLSDPASSKKLSAGAIAGIIVGAIFVLFVGFFLGMMCWERCQGWRQRRRNLRWIEETEGVLDSADDSVPSKPKPYRSGSMFDRVTKIPFARKMRYKPIVEEKY